MLKNFLLILDSTKETYTYKICSYTTTTLLEFFNSLKLSKRQIQMVVEDIGSECLDIKERFKNWKDLNEYAYNKRSLVICYNRVTGEWEETSTASIYKYLYSNE